MLNSFAAIGGQSGEPQVNNGKGLVPAAGAPVSIIILADGTTSLGESAQKEATPVSCHPLIPLLLLRVSTVVAQVHGSCHWKKKGFGG